MAKSVCVILVNYNTPQHTADCIKSLQTYCDQSLFDIVVVDNASADDSVALLQSQFPSLHFILNTSNLGFAEGNNKGLEYSFEKGYTYSLPLNTDTLVDEDAISVLTAHLDQHPGAAAVQPAIYWMYNHNKLWNGPGYFNQLLGDTRSKTDVSEQHAANGYKTVDWLSGCCMLIRNSILKEAGVFNKQFFLYYEDVELSFRIRRQGYQLHYLPATKIYHEAGVSGKTKQKGDEGFLNPVIHYYNSRNHIWVLRRYGSTLLFPLYLITNGAYYTAVLLYLKMRGRNKKVSSLLKGLKDGLFTPQSVIWPNN